MEIRPFRGWRYRPGPDGTVSDRIAPPYDILSAADKQSLLARSGQNIVAVDLPRVPLAISLLSYFVLFLVMEISILHRRTSPLPEAGR